MNDISLQPRRQFLGRLVGGAAVLGWGLPVVPRWLLAEEAPAGKLIVRQENPYNAEPPLDRLLDHWVTGQDDLFVRSHGNVPDIDESSYRLSIEGMVEKPLNLSLAELRERFPAVATTATLTCAGNRRSEFQGEKKISGVQWQAGAIGTVEWSGVNLSDVLKLVGVKPDAKHVWFDGLDDIVDGGKKLSFGASIPLDKAMSSTQFTPGALLVNSMNGKPLTKSHGAPLRTVVPGYIGARSVKWLGKITVSDQPSPNHYVADVYKVLTEGTEAERIATQPINEFIINSAICKRSAAKEAGKVRLFGYALPSGSPGCLIRSVELTVDEGKTWTAARLISARREFCWVFWEAELPATALGKTVLVKATDSQGTSQPRVTPFNLKGYQFNGWHKMELQA